jgi:hypothetical protein
MIGKWRQNRIKHGAVQSGTKEDMLMLPGRIKTTQATARMFLFFYGLILLFVHAFPLMSE